MDAQLAQRILRLEKRLDDLVMPETGGALDGVISTYLALPGLRGFWPMSSVGTSGVATDISEQGRTLTNNNTVVFGATGLAPWAEFDGSTNYLSRTDESGLDIIGNEAYIDAPGLTIGCWVSLDAFAAPQVIIGKRIAAMASTSSSYSIYVSTSQVPLFQMANGSTAYGSGTVSGIIAQNVWAFLVGRFIPSTEIATFLNNEKAANTTSIPATINNSGTALTVGAAAAPGGYTNGKIALPFLCVSALTDAQISNLYQTSRGLFGV